MDIDFAFWLVLATAFTGTVVLIDRFWLRRQRVAQAGEPLVIEYSKSFFPVLALVLVLRSFLAEPFTIPSGSMLPTLQIGDYIVVNKYAYGLRLPVIGTRILDVGEPQQGDIMVFRFPEKPSTSFIKRVIGVPGDVIAYDDGVLSVNGKTLPLQLQERQVLLEGGAALLFRQAHGNHSFVVRRDEGKDTFPGPWQVRVPASHYFVMGDNRDNSYDSRGWGFVPNHLIVGKAVYIWMHKDPGLHWPTFARNGTVYGLDDTRSE